MDPRLNDERAVARQAAFAPTQCLTDELRGMEVGEHGSLRQHASALEGSGGIVVGERD